eukprot:14030-Eustigmatos_ZCMA.PRE.1
MSVDILHVLNKFIPFIRGRVGSELDKFADVALEAVGSSLFDLLFSIYINQGVDLGKNTYM